MFQQTIFHEASKARLKAAALDVLVSQLADGVNGIAVTVTQDANGDCDCEFALLQGDIVLRSESL